MSTYYIAGPMTGIKDFNFPAFYEAEKILNNNYPELVIINPARMSDERGEYGYDACIERDLEVVEQDATDMVFLPGWENSKGAWREYQLALKLGLGLHYYKKGKLVNFIAKQARFNSGKPNWGLIPFKAVEPIIQVMMKGAEKYAPYNWQNGDAEQNFQSLMRHLVSWQSGEKIDQESGLTHLAHAGCNIIFMLWHELYKEGKVQKDIKE